MTKQHNTSINSETKESLTELLFQKISSTESQEVIEMLLKNRADVNARIIIGFNILTPLMTAISFYYNTGANIIKLLIQFGANVNYRDAWGATPLFFATLQRNHEAIKILLELGADVNAKDKSGRIALDYAKDSATKEILERAMYKKA